MGNKIGEKRLNSQNQIKIIILLQNPDSVLFVVINPLIQLLF